MNSPACPSSPRIPCLLVQWFVLLTALLIGAGNSVHAQTSSSPLRDMDVNPASTFSWQPGVFGSTFGSNGWPDGVSNLGRDPNSLRLEFGSIPFNDLLTERPRFDLLPQAWLSHLYMQEGQVISEFDSLNTLTPETRLRYQSAGNGSQAVRVLHVQNRTISRDSVENRLQTAFGYAGEGARGEYDGMRLRRGREVSFRVRYVAPRFSLEFFEAAQRRSVGAQAGVVPFTGAGFESIYQRLGASVQDEDARRRTIRSDSYVRGSTTLSGWNVSVAPFLSVQTLDFRNDTDALKGLTRKIGLHTEASTSFRSQQIRFALETWKREAVKGSAYGGSEGASSTFRAAKISTLGSFSSMKYQIEAGPESMGDQADFAFRANSQVSEGLILVSLTVLRQPQFRAQHELIGFGTTLLPYFEDRKSVNQEAELSFGLQSTWFSISATGFAHRSTDKMVVRLDPDRSEDSSGNFSWDATSAASELIPGSTMAKGVSVELGFRDRNERVIWASANLVRRRVTTDATSNVAALYRTSLPTAWGSAQVGVKALLFDEDLDLNAYVRGRFWGEMSGLRLHTPTGLLALPFEDSERVEANWLVDIVVEAGVREATLFISYENMFSGTTAQVGNLLIPNYPLPRQRTRFGVYWPIFN